MVGISWKELWSFFGTSAVEVKKSIVSNLIQDDWLENLSTDMQVNVLKGCPEYLVDYLSPRLRITTLTKLAGVASDSLIQTESNIVVGDWVKALKKADDKLARKAGKAGVSYKRVTA